MDKLSRDILIEKYLRSNLTDEEETRIQNLFLEEPSLRKDLEDLKPAYKLVDLSGRQNLKNKISNFDQETEQSNSKDRMRFVRLMCLWIGFFILGIFAAKQFKGKPKSEKLYLAYFETYDSPSVLRDNDDTPNISWNKAIEAYNAKQFSKAYLEFQKTSDDIPDYKISFYSGQCLMSQKNPDWEAASVHFQSVLKTENDLAPQSLWYIALIDLQLGNSHEAESGLGYIIAIGTYNSEKALKLLDEIRD